MSNSKKKKKSGGGSGGGAHVIFSATNRRKKRSGGKRRKTRKMVFGGSGGVFTTPAVIATSVIGLLSLLAVGGTVMNQRYERGGGTTFGGEEPDIATERRPARAGKKSGEDQSDWNSGEGDEELSGSGTESKGIKLTLKEALDKQIREEDERRAKVRRENLEKEAAAAAKKVEDRRLRDEANRNEIIRQEEQKVQDEIAKKLKQEEQQRVQKKRAEENAVYIQEIRTRDIRENPQDISQYIPVQFGEEVKKGYVYYFNEAKEEGGAPIMVGPYICTIGTSGGGFNQFERLMGDGGDRYVSLRTKNKYDKGHFPIYILRGDQWGQGENQDVGLNAIQQNLSRQLANRKPTEIKTSNGGGKE